MYRLNGSPVEPVYRSYSAVVRLTMIGGVLMFTRAKILKIASLYSYRK